MNAPTQTLKALMNALAFANVNNLGEFRAMLHKVDAAEQSAHQPSPHASAPVTCSASDLTPAVGYVQGAL